MDHKKVVLCVPTTKRPYKQLLDSIELAVPVLEASGIEHGMVSEIGNPYISQARNVMLRKALDAKATHIVFLDHDVSFGPDDLLRLINAPAEVVAGTYRFKKAEEEYMGSVFTDSKGAPQGKQVGDLVMLQAKYVPAGFLRVTETAVSKFIEMYPELMFGSRHTPHVDLFNHGAMDFVWHGEDYGFSKRWNDKCGQLWLLPELNITHHASDGTAYVGNYHEYLMRQPGGAKSQ